MRAPLARSPSVLADAYSTTPRSTIARTLRGSMRGDSRVLPGGNAMSWRKLATGSGSTGVTTADSDVRGAMENMIARSALLNRSSMAAVWWDFDGETDA